MSRVIEAAKKFEELKEQMNAVGEELTAALLEAGADTYHQDPDTLAVYKVIVPNGTFVEYRSIGYKRTALEGERGGTVLSKKEAEEKGFSLK